jgi:hypothetical protein
MKNEISGKNRNARHHRRRKKAWQWPAGVKMKAINLAAKRLARGEMAGESNVA